jgi:hypothetical protein
VALASYLLLQQSPSHAVSPGGSCPASLATLPSRRRCPVVTNFCTADCLNRLSCTDPHDSQHPQRTQGEGSARSDDQERSPAIKEVMTCPGLLLCGLAPPPLLWLAVVEKLPAASTPTMALFTSSGSAHARRDDVRWSTAGMPRRSSMAAFSFKEVMNL